MGRIRQHIGTDLPPIHHHIPSLSHGPLHLGQLDAHLWNGADIRRGSSHFLGTQQLGNILPIQIGMLRPVDIPCKDIRIREQ